MDPAPVRVRFSNARDAKGQRHSSVAITHRTALGNGIIPVGWCEHVGNAAAGEEGCRVIPGHACVGSAHAVTVAPRIDKRRVARAQLIGIQSQALQRTWSKAGQEDVSRCEQLMEYPLTAFGADIECDRSLTPVS